MFPGFRERFGAALDLIVEFSTLGEYRLATPVADRPSTPRAASEQGPRLGGAGGDAARAVGRRTVAGGAVAPGRGFMPSAPLRGAAATPAARRRLAAARAAAGRVQKRPARRHLAQPHASSPRPRARRAGAPSAAEQLCLAV